MTRIAHTRAGRALVLVALLFPPPALFAQGFDTLADEAYEAMPEETPLPLEQLVDTDAPLPDLPELDFDAPVSASGPADDTVRAEEFWAEAGLPDAVPVDDEAGRDTADAVAGAGMAPVAPPGDWVWHDFDSTRFAVPGDWAVMEEDDLELVVFSGDTAPPTGHILMITISDRDGDSIDEVIASAVDEGGNLGEQGEITLPGGEVFDWADLEMNLGGVAMEIRLYVSRSMFTQDRAPFVISAGTVGAAAPLDPAVREAFLASFRFAAAAPPPDAEPEDEAAETGRLSLLDGRITLTPPAGWMVIEYPDEAALTSPGNAVSVRFLRGAEVRLRLDRLPDGATPEKGRLAGHPVLIHETPEGRLNVWTQCPRPNAPLAVLVSGGSGFAGTKAHETIFGDLSLDGMTDAPDCAFVTRRTAPETGAPQQAAPSEQQAAPPDMSTGDASQTVRRHVPSDWVWHDWQGVRFAVPDGWSLQEETEDSLVVARWTGTPGEGHILKVSLDEVSGPELMAAMQLADDLGITVLDQGEMEIGGAELFHWARFDDREEPISSALYAADEPFGETGKYLNIAIASNGPVPEMDPVIQDIFLMSFQFLPTEAAGTTQSGQEGPETGRAAENGGADPAQDSFADIGGGYTTYRNARYGTEVSYPGTYFIAQPAPDSGDGRRFEAVDGQASFIVFTQYDALERGLAGMQADIRADLDDVQKDNAAPGVFEIAGTDGQTGRVFKVIRDADGLTRRLEITYPLARAAEFQPVVDYMALSLGPPPDLRVAVPQPPDRVMVPPPPGTEASPAPGQAPLEGLVADFSNGQSNGWTGLLTQLRPQRTGGPDGRGYLESLSPGDGQDGYYVAPDAFHGDWRGLRSVEVQIRADTGEFYGETGRGGADIVIEGAGGAARTGFDVPIGRAWTTQRVRLDDAGRWTLTGSASRLEDVLADVTGFRIRAEYILGDTSGGLARVALAGREDGAGQGAGLETPMRGSAPVTLGDIFTPDRGTALRSALMDAAREPVQREIGVPILFVVDVLNTDGTWAYLQGRPVNRNGSAIDWSRTQFAREMAGGFMSDVVMVLFRKDSGRWGVVDYVLGPTDVAWYDWVTAYGLPEWFFRN